MPQQQKKKNKKQIKIPKSLTKPIIWDGPPRQVVRGLLTDDTSFSQLEAQNSELVAEADERVAKMTLVRLMVLAESLGIDTKKDQWPLRLSLLLAQSLCRGLDVEEGPPRRRPKVWTTDKYVELARDVEKVKEEKSCNDTTAIRTLIKKARKTKDARYLPKADSTDAEAAKTLLNRLAEARNPKHNYLACLLSRPLTRSEMESVHSLRDYANHRRRRD